MARRPPNAIIAHTEIVGTAGAGVGVGTGGAGPPKHAVTVLLSSVTAAFRARALPFTLALVFKVMLWSARIFPANEVVVPRVAELPTCHHTPQAEAPLVSVIEELLAVVSVLPIWKM